MLVIKIVLRIGLLLLNAPSQLKNMAEGDLRAAPTDEESLNFAKSLYSSIWMKFGVVHGVDDPIAAEADDYGKPFHLDISRAVMCEQMLTRSFCKYYLFASKKSFIFRTTMTALTLCKYFCEKTNEWNYFKRIFRFSALLAEFFLYRTRRTTFSELQEAPLIWNIVFQKYFAATFYTKGGWEKLLECSLKYSDVYPPLEAIIEDMPSPYDSMPIDYEQNIPRHVTIVETNPEKIDQEMAEIFALKKKRITSIDHPSETDVPGDYESESTRSDSSSEGDRPPAFKSRTLIRLLSQIEKSRSRCPPPSDDEDMGSTKKPKDPLWQLSQPSCSSAMDTAPDTSPSDEEPSKVEQSSDDSSLELIEAEKKDPRKRFRPVDTSDSDVSIQAKQRKLSDA